MAAIFGGSGNTLKRWFECITSDSTISGDDMKKMKTTVKKKFSFSYDYKGGRGKTVHKSVPVTVFNMKLP